jgi:hypothetical protein
MEIEDGVIWVYGVGEDGVLRSMRHSTTSCDADIAHENDAKNTQGAFFSPARPS